MNNSSAPSPEGELFTDSLTSLDTTCEGKADGSAKGSPYTSVVLQSSQDNHYHLVENMMIDTKLVSIS